jgi:hypothetical protein
MLPRAKQPKYAGNDESTLVKAERRGKQESLQRIQQALHVLLTLKDRFVEPGIAQPDLWILLVELRDRVPQMLSSSTEPTI